MWQAKWKCAVHAKTLSRNFKRKRPNGLKSIKIDVTGTGYESLDWIQLAQYEV
jgi:hypothetical protein